jgi:ethanolamine-phosphate cytidylyltransferase
MDVSILGITVVFSFWEIIDVWAGHAGAILQAKRMGKCLVVGVHSDEEITVNKGPPVMTLEERYICPWEVSDCRCASVKACKWTDEVVPYAPYVTEEPWIDRYGCQYVVHGDDISTDADGKDCYEGVKKAGRFLVCKRTEGISTTGTISPFLSSDSGDLVGRMLLCTRNHLIPPSSNIFTESKTVEMLKNYASPPSGSGLGTSVFRFQNDSLVPIIKGNLPTQDRKVIYVDGTFDLFTPGHIELLRLISASSDPPPYVVVGIHDDYAINKIKGYNYPIMNILERSLVVLQCKYVSALVVSAPYTPSKSYLTQQLGPLKPVEVWHGPRKVIEAPGEGDPYADATEMGILRTIDKHPWDDISARKIVDRILNRRIEFEERQRKKGVKSDLEREMKMSTFEVNPWAEQDR